MNENNTDCIKAGAGESEQNPDNNPAAILECIIKQYGISKRPVNTYSPLTLAFIGDSIYALVVKSVVTLSGNVPANTLNRLTNNYVKAVSQAKVVTALLDEHFLSEKEEDILRRGRNAKSATTAKNASVGDYRLATGLEALVGYLYLNGEQTRLIEIIRFGMEVLDGSKA